MSTEVVVLIWVTGALAFILALFGASKKPEPPPDDVWQHRFDGFNKPKR